MGVGSRERRGLRLFAALLSLACLYWPSTASAAAAEPQVTLIRVYDSEARGVVYEVCRGEFDPPVTDPLNPAYCRGQPEYWTQSRWQAYNRASSEKQDTKKPPRDNGPPKAAGQPQVAVGQPPTGAQSAVPYGGSLDPTSVLGVTNPLCGEHRQLSARQLRNCRSSRSPEAAYPVGNYGWDIHIEEGGFITSLLAPTVSFFLQFLSVFWLALLLVLKGCLIVLGFAFSLSPFTDNQMLREIAQGLTRFYNNFTDPWLTALIVILGIWGLYNGILRRRAGETLGGTLAALVMMLIAMWMIHAPGDSVGRLAAIINKTSLVAVSAPNSGRVSQPVRSYGDAMGSVWNQMTAVPFCALNFSDVDWCLKAKPSKEAVEAARNGLSLEEPLTQALLADLPEDDAAATRVLSRRMNAVFGGATTISSLYLRFSPGSGPRDALWKYYNGEGDDHVGLPLHIGPQINIGGGTEGAAPDKVSMQGRSGLLPRMVLLVVFFFGLLGGLLLLLWIAMKLVMASASAFVLVLMAPLAMFLPVFGAAGRAAFTKWGTSLLGAVIAKLIFSALLGVVLLGSSILGSGVGGSSPALGLIATMSFWWAVFLNRERYLALLQIDPVRDEGTSFYRTMAGGYVGYRFARAAKNAIGRRRDASREQSSQRRDEQVRAGREAGDQELGRQAQQRLDVATGNAKAREGLYTKAKQDAAALRADPEVQALRREGADLQPEVRDRAEEKARQLHQLEGQIDASRSGSMADRQLLRRVGANEAAGLPRYGSREIEGAKEAIRRESSLPSDAPEHSWRAQAAGKDPKSAAGRAVINESLEQSRAAVGAASATRLSQVDLHRLRGVSGGRRRPMRGPTPSGEPGKPAGAAAGPRRRSRAREGLSR